MATKIMLEVFDKLYHGQQFLMSGAVGPLGWTQSLTDIGNHPLGALLNLG